MDGSQHRHEVVAEGVPRGLRQPGGVLGVPVDDAAHVLHDVERGAEHLRVLAQGEHGGHRHVGLLQSRQDAVLADHVVRTGGQRAQGRAADDDTAATARDPVGEVGQATGHERRVPVRSEVGYAAGRPLGERLAGEAAQLFGPRPVGGHAPGSAVRAATRSAARRAARRAIDIRCTSEAPS